MKPDIAKLFRRIYNMHKEHTKYAIYRISNMGAAMRTTLDLPEELVEEVVRMTGAKSKTTAISLALQEYVQSNKRLKILDYRGKIDLDLTTEKIREDRDKWDERRNR